jgi:hypothetical protein
MSSVMRARRRSNILSTRPAPNFTAFLLPTAPYARQRDPSCSRNDRQPLETVVVATRGLQRLRAKQKLELANTLESRRRLRVAAKLPILLERHHRLPVLTYQIGHAPHLLGTLNVAVRVSASTVASATSSCTRRSRSADRDVKGDLLVTRDLYTDVTTT